MKIHHFKKKSSHSKKFLDRQNCITLKKMHNFDENTSLIEILSFQRLIVTLMKIVLMIIVYRKIYEFDEIMLLLPKLVLNINIITSRITQGQSLLSWIGEIKFKDHLSSTEAEIGTVLDILKGFDLCYKIMEIY